VYPPGRSTKRGAIFSKTFLTVVRSGIHCATLRRAARSSALAAVIKRSASGRSSLAFESVVWIRSCVISDAS
jgi:hypothetical protein